ncbi:MAG: hypothetical protein ACR2LI_12450 [Propionibacteriaceae bacterium]
MVEAVRSDAAAVDELAAELERGVVAAADRLADASALYERMPWGWAVPAGVYARIRTVRAAEWALAVHAMIEGGELDEVRGRLVSRSYLHRLVDELAGEADWQTGRNCMPGHVELGAKLGRPVKAARLAAMAAMSTAARAQAEAQIALNRTRQVGNAIEVLITAAVLHRVEDGRILPLLERLELWANGSHRRVARAVYALTVPVEARLNVASPVDNCPAPDVDAEPIFVSPRSGLDSSSSSDSLVAFRSVDRRNSESTPTCAQPGRHTARLAAGRDHEDAASRRPAAKRRALWELEPGLYAFVVALRTALPDQLSGVSVRKLAGTTKRFWEAGWAPLDVAESCREVYAQDGKAFPTYRPGQPARWLGWVLKRVDVATTPALRRYDAWAAAADTEPCPHGEPGGARLSVITGRARCPLCRAAAP